jgi:hypothetical protein
MSLINKHNLDQLRKVRQLSKGTDIGDRTKLSYATNPLDNYIETYEDFLKSNNKVKTIKVKKFGDMLVKEAFANGNDSLYSTYYKKDFSKDEVEQALAKYLTWCKKNEQTAEYTDVDQIDNDEKLSHVLYHAEIEGYKIDESLKIKK